ncbi:hypothetical protein [Caulobacter henricii]|nr:hypothetical protein [Caulobacter henricii]
MLRSLNAFENAVDRLAGGYFLVLALALAGSVAGIVL